MTRKINPKNEALGGFFLIISSGIAGLTIGCTLPFYGFDFLSPQALGTTGVMIGAVTFACRQFGVRFPVGWKKKSITLAHNVDVLRAAFMEEDTMIPEPPEFIFRGLDLPTNIPESLLRHFCTIAERRNFYFRHGGQLSAWATAHGPRLTNKNQVLAQSYYTKSVRPRFVPVEVEGCKKILGYTGQLVNWRQGAAGELIGEYPASKRVSTAKRLWPYLTTPRKHRQN